MIRRILFALACMLSIPAILGPQAAHSTIAPASPELLQGERISVMVTGKGSPVILIPGLSSPRAVWDGVAPELARTHTVYLVQINGFGGDDPRANLQPGILSGVVAELHGLIADRRIKGAAVVGHSLGGLVGMLLAKAHPGDLARLMIVDSLPFIGSAFVPGSTVETIKPHAETARAQMAGLYGKPFPAAVGQAIANANALKPESRAKVAAWSAAADMRVSAQAVYEDMLTDLRPDLKGIATPITILVPWTAARGEERVLGFYKGEYAGAPHAAFVGVADSGHFVMLDQPEAFRAALAAFLAG